ncbi:MAG: hypothetical protein OJF50_002507 [Nitrospira sp.]|jgi:hypothetical protein|nr:hypothetical protein [Nitrospira sp.]
MKFRIQRGQVGQHRERNRYPLKEMQVGDFFVIPKKQVPRGRLQGIGRYLGIKISVRTLEDGSVRCQRVL